MNTRTSGKITKLIQEWIPGTVITTAWAERQFNVSGRELAGYVQSGWIDRLGRGAYKRKNDTVDWTGGLYALQTQIHTPVHVGGLSAISMQGLSHYLRPGDELVSLFSPPDTYLPAWFKNHDWTATINQTNTSMLPLDLGIHPHSQGLYTIAISTPERAMLECLYHAPVTMDLVECYQIMEGLVNLRPNLLQGLLESCTSIKVKRLFLYLADKANHHWFPFVDLNPIDLGSGHRYIGSGGVFVEKYLITVPEELAHYV